ncbi:DEKNAAC102271 [Brettanomyces naardenensis]|uniref:DEKNAAC102271 n=1 Tax=Brettanomyces naardenensis TaxID=13370 RepID=A0A448YKK6_BRENA|nr:DEKNAAC102271 [Brettanomyces naardenensis]
MYRGRGGYRGGYKNNNYHNSNSSSNGFMNPQQSLDRANAFNSSNMVSVQIQGWTNASEPDLVSFISRKAKIALQNVESNRSTGVLTASVRNAHEAEEVRKCSGIRFAGATLNVQIIDPANGGRSQVTQNTVELLRSFLRTRFNPSAKMLDLTNMVNDPTLVQNGLFSNPNTSSKFFPALMKLANQDKLDIESVNLSDNLLDDHCKYLVDLAASYPNLKNLAIGNNNIRRMEFFDRLKTKFAYLRELIVSGNPIVATNDANILKGIVDIFPRLIILNGQQVRDESKVNAIFNFPVATKSMFFETPDLSKVAANFIATFLTMWDGQRLNLLQLYTPDSQFSYQVDTTHLGETPMSSTTNWSYYLSHSRNLKRVSGARPRMSRLYIGTEAIGKAFQGLPKTKHSLQEFPALYSMETTSFPPLNGMQITLHGEFNETGPPEHPAQDHRPTGRFNKYGSNQARGGQLEKRSFDRTLIVVPGPSGGFIVASDLLLVKPYAGNSAWLEHKAPAVAPIIPAVPANGVHQVLPNQVLPSDVASKLSAEQQQLVVKIMHETRLNLQFTIMLCEQSNWNYATAGQNFANSKSQIPPQAYQQ